MALIDVALEDYDRWGEDERVTFLYDIRETYNDLVTEFYDEAKWTGRWFNSLRKTHFRWRLIITLSAGFVAILNVFGGFNLADDKNIPLINIEFVTLLALIGAVVATFVTILTRLETFGSAHERAPAYRQARDLFLDAARDFEGRWREHVRPFKTSAEACVNAVELNRQIIDRDRELRGQFREMTSMGDSK